MLILLPPSEGKTAPASGLPLDVDAVSLSSLNPTRRLILDALVKVCSGQSTRALRALGLSAGQGAEIERNRGLVSAPTAPAAQVYSGVLFDALGYPSLPMPARKRLNRWVVVSSALWGAVRLTDPIPAYRLSAGVTLPRIGSVTKAWRAPLAAALPDVVGNGVVFDLRSGGYASMWTPPEEQTVVGRVVQESPDGTLRVVSHHNKATKGRLVADLARQSTTPRTIDALLETLSGLGYQTAETTPQRGLARNVDIIVAEL